MGRYDSQQPKEVTAGYFDQHEFSAASTTKNSALQELKGYEYSTGLTNYFIIESGSISIKLFKINDQREGEQLFFDEE